MGQPSINILESTMSYRVLLKNPMAIVTCDPEDRVLLGQDLLVEGKTIVGMGPDLDGGEVDELIDCSGKVIYPGLINTHHHFFQTFVRNRIDIDYPSMTVVEWLDKIYRIFALMDEEMIYYSSFVALTDLVKHGCTTAFDHQYCQTKPHGIRMLDQQILAADQIGIRYVGGRGGNTLSRDQGSTIPDPMLESTEEFILDCERLIHSYHDPEPFSMKQVVVAPCQPVNCLEETFLESVKLARRLGVRMHTHLGEGENPIMQERYGMRTLDWCEKIGFIGPDVWYAHCWELSREEFERIGAYGGGVSHCPSPAVLGGFPIIDLLDIEKTGTVLSLGCDGSATNDGSNLLDILRMTYLMQAWHSKQRNGNAQPYDILLMATRGGAKTLGRPEIGHLAPGMAADLFAYDFSGLEFVGATHDFKNILPRLACTGSVDFTMVNGRIIYRQGRLLLADEEALRKEAAKSQARIQALMN